MNRVLKQDVDQIVDRLSDDWKKFINKSILITGATGLIGSLITRVLLELNARFDANVRILLIARTKQGVIDLFGGDIDTKAEIYVQSDIADHISIPEKIDFIVHTAAPASSKYFVEEPVETVEAIVSGSKQMLEIAKEKNVSKIVLMSSMEAYGICGVGGVKEDCQGYIDLSNVRSSYAIGKRTAEFLSYAYYKEYGVPAISIRLAMCFGAGQKVNDPRVHTAFCNAAMGGHDIEMKSAGKNVINFVYSADAILAILLLLIDGKDGETYNVAGDSLGYNILNMAEYIARRCGVKVKKTANDARIASDDAMILDTGKISTLGWKPKYNIEEALERYVNYLGDLHPTVLH